MSKYINNLRDLRVQDDILTHRPYHGSPGLQVSQIDQAHLELLKSMDLVIKVEFPSCPGTQELIGTVHGTLVYFDDEHLVILNSQKDFVVCEMFYLRFNAFLTIPLF